MSKNEILSGFGRKIEPERLYSCEECAYLLSTTAQTIRSWARDRKLKTIQFGRAYRIKGSTLLGE